MTSDVARRDLVGRENPVDRQGRGCDVRLGAIGTAALFEIGKFLLGFDIGTQGLESTYGAAASRVIVLIWVYDAAQLVLFGAEFTHACARQGGRAPVARGAQAADARAT